MHSNSGCPNHADCETNYNSVHFLVVEPDLSSPAEAFSAFTLCEGRCTGAGAGACAPYRRHRLCTPGRHAHRHRWWQDHSCPSRQCAQPLSAQRQGAGDDGKDRDPRPGRHARTSLLSHAAATPGWRGVLWRGSGQRSASLPGRRRDDGADCGQRGAVHRPGTEARDRRRVAART